jgi:anti-anti-sigma factor
MSYTITLDEIDSANADVFRDQVAEAVAHARDDGGVAELDFGQVTFMGSIGIRVLCELQAVLMQQGGTIRIHNVSSSVGRLLEITGLDDLVEA